MKKPLLLVPVAGIIAVLAFPGTSLARDDVTSLKTTYTLLLQAVRQGNVGLVQNLVHPRAIGFFADSQFPVVLGSVRVSEVVSTLVADLAKFTSVQYDAEYRVVGTTGVVAVRTTEQPNRGTRAKPSYLRSTFVFTKVDDRWLLVSWHTSEIPLKK